MVYLLVAVVAAVAVVTAAMALTRPGGDSDDANMPYFEARRGPLTISVTESGTIKARDQVIIKSEVEGQTTIIQLVDEGKMVEAGELLVELDASKLVDSRLDQQIRVQNAEASFIQARENMEVIRSQGQSDIAKAQLNHQFAQEDLSQYVEGQYPKQKKESQSRIELAVEELTRAQEKLRWSQRLQEESYLSQSELEADRIAAKRAELDHELSVADLQLLEKYTYERKMTELNSNIEQTRMELDRVQRRARADIIQAEANLKAKEAEFGQQKDKLAKFESQIEKTKIYAPIAGMVVYATSAQGSWRGNAEPLDEGQQVRERQELIYLPTANAMMAEISVHESSLDKVKLSQRVRITVDALPGQQFGGTVAKIAPLPDAASMWLNPDLKVFSTQIHLDAGSEGLRTGMSCRAEIIVEQYDDAVYVPVQSVVRIGNQPVVYVMAGQRSEPRSVRLGLDNNRMVRIIDGLEGGETVLMTPPLSAGEVEAAAVADQTVDTPTPKVDAAAGSAPAPVPGTNVDAATPQPQPAAEAGQTGDEDAQRAERRRQFENMSEEDRQKMRERFQNMSPEERQRMRQQSGGGGGGNGGGRPQGGAQP
jgi:HlyD family secretion protein